MATADKPPEGQVIDKGLPGPGLVAHVITSKYCDHQPLYRLEGMLARHGVSIARSTMCGWMKAAADLLTPLVQLMAARIRGSKVIHTDDTPMPVQDKGRGKTKTGRLWVYLGDPTSGGSYDVFDYTESRSRDGPRNWLKEFKGYLQADAFGGYDGIYATGDVTEVACWAHARRKFYDARTSDPAREHHVLAMIRLLYDVERDAKERQAEDKTFASGGAQAKRAMRQERSCPLLEQLHAWLLRERDGVLPKSPMGQAIGYALNNWDALVRYAGDGDLAIDNNAAERAIRPLTIGRKNYLFFGSDGGGRTAAILYSVVAGAKRHGLDPFVYLRDVLAVIGSTPMSQLDQFLPDRWKAQ
ncbi:MAG: IS66 family transposase [Phycisphaeraceae bacterium]